MADFRLSVVKGTIGEILVYGNYLGGNEPVFVERVNIVELDESGNSVFASSHHVHRSIDPGVGGSYLLVSKPPSGKNIKAARATAYYIEIEETAQSDTLKL